MNWLTRLRAPLAALLLALFTYVLFSVATDYGFVSWDDPDYVTANERVRLGLDGGSLGWALGLHAGNWHPLTWLSHMADAEWYGDDAAGHHRTSVLLHAFNAGLLLLALFALTRAFFPSLVVAILFAVHPLRVESVAWVSERKDVLSGFFAIATLWAYAGWARRGGLWRYLLCLLCFGLGMLSKSMLVTLPCVLLLLDAWPLCRPSTWESGPAAVPLERKRTIGALFVEKLPFFLIVGVVIVQTIDAQGASGSIRTSDEISYAERLIHAPGAYWRYLQQTFWPTALACFYPHPAIVDPDALSVSKPPFWMGLGVLVSVTVLCLLQARKRPQLLVGWFWFVGMLVPVIGIMQVGAQATADRYTYLPSIGLAILIVWGLGELLLRSRTLQGAAVGALVVVVVFLGKTTRAQSATWESSETLFAHALQVTERNYKAHNSYGVVLESQGQVEEARAQYEAAIAIQPRHVQALTNLGKYHAGKGDMPKAEELLKKALAQDPLSVPTLGNLGAIRLNRGDIDGGIEMLEKALEVKEDHALHHYNLGLALQMARRPEEAREHLKRAGELDPRFAKP